MFKFEINEKIYLKLLEINEAEKLFELLDN